MPGHGHGVISCHYYHVKDFFARLTERLQWGKDYWVRAHRWAINHHVAQDIPLQRWCSYGVTALFKTLYLRQTYYIFIASIQAKYTRYTSLQEIKSRPNRLSFKTFWGSPPCVASGEQSSDRKRGKTAKKTGQRCVAGYFRHGPQWHCVESTPYRHRTLPARPSSDETTFFSPLLPRSFSCFAFHRNTNIHSSLYFSRI